MTLAARLSAFFLTTLALVLAGFSTTLYLLARTHLYRQVDERLIGALDTLAAAAEVDPDGVEWEPHEHRLTLGQDAAAEQVRWTVQDDTGQPVDKSANLTNAGSQTPTSEEANFGGGPWHLLQREVRAARTDSTPIAPHKHTALVLTAGASLEPVQGTLRTLAGILTALSVALWALAALLGRWLCRRALAPVTRMASAARALHVADPEGRLPNPGTGDELDDLSRAFNDLVARLHEALERQRRFTGDASHQLRTPLTALLGQIEVVLRRDRPAGEYREVLALVHGQAEQLRQIVEMLLFLARADAEARLPNLEILDLATWLPTFVQRWTEHPRSADLRLDCPAASSCGVEVQTPLLGQLLSNLVENAFNYSEPGTPVILRLACEGETFALTVEDHGPGISADDLPHVFEPFYRSPHVGRLGGAGVGLGLAVARRIAIAFGGVLDVESSLGQGSRFTLRLSVKSLLDVDAQLPKNAPFPIPPGARQV